MPTANRAALDKLLEQELSAAEVSELPRHFFERYVQRLNRIRKEADDEIQVKLNEITGRVQRELADFRKLLLAEWRSERHQGKST